MQLDGKSAVLRFWTGQGSKHEEAVKSRYSLEMEKMHEK
jgi:hypothetical protein